MCLSAAPQSEYTFSDCGSSSAPGGSAQGPSGALGCWGGKGTILNKVSLLWFIFQMYLILMRDC